MRRTAFITQNTAITFRMHLFLFSWNCHLHYRLQQLCISRYLLSFHYSKKCLELIDRQRKRNATAALHYSSNNPYTYISFRRYLHVSCSVRLETESATCKHCVVLHPVPPVTSTGQIRTCPVVRTMAIFGSTTIRFVMPYLQGSRCTDQDGVNECWNGTWSKNISFPPFNS